MEYQFENVHTYTRENIEEYIACLNESRRVSMIVILCVLLMVQVGVCMCLHFEPITVIIAVAVLVMLVRTIRQPKAQAKREYETMLAFYDGEIQPRFIRFGDMIHIEAKHSSQFLEYRKITQVMSLPHSYVLIDQRSTATMLDRDGFTKGTFAEFKQFLREKCPDLTIPE